MLQRLLPQYNIWRLRNEYIVDHSIWSELKTIKNHFSKKDFCDWEKLNLIVESGRKYFPSSFRNNMMHYDLIYNGIPSIREEKFCPNIIFFGLVESCFPGKSAEEYFNELREYMAEIEAYINGWFIIDKTKIRWNL